MKLPSFKFRRKKKDTEPVEASNAPPRPATNSSSGAQQWLLLHFEKPLLFAVLIIFGLLVYSAVGKLQVQSDQTPEKLAKMATQFEARIEQSAWDKGSYPIPDFSEKITAARSEITPDLYTFKAPGIEKIKIGAKRSKPDFLAAKDLRAAGGNGIFWIKNSTKETDDKPDNKVQGKKGEGAKSKTPQPPRRGVAPPKNSAGEGRRWVVITALAPLAEQTNNYLVHFADAGGYDPKRDVPVYLAARIQRFTVSGMNVDEKVEWEKDREWEWSELEGKEANWAARAPEPVDPLFIDLALAKPLGPLAFRNWGHWATHPEIPLAQPKANKGRPPARGPRGGNPTPGLIDPNVPGGGNANVQSQPQEPGPTTADNGPTSGRSAGIRLVRIFDYDVEAGKIYRYRIQLRLKNPNVGIDPRFLENPAQMQDGEYRESAWSGPSNVVRVPDDRQVYVATIDEEKNEEEKTSITVGKSVVREIDFIAGEQRTGRVSLQPGEVANQKTAAEQLQQGKDGPDITKNNPISTDLVLLDWHGGEPLGGFGGPPDGDQDLPAPEQTVMTAPAEMLFLDSQGNIFMKTSVRDAAVTGAFDKQWEFQVNKKNERKAAVKKRPGDDDDSVNLLRNEDKDDPKEKRRREREERKAEKERKKEEARKKK